MWAQSSKRRLQTYHSSVLSPTPEYYMTVFWCVVRNTVWKWYHVKWRRLRHCWTEKLAARMIPLHCLWVEILLKMLDRSRSSRRKTHRFWSLCTLSLSKSKSKSVSPHPANITSSQSPPSRSPSLTSSTFHSRLKTHLFRISFPP